LVLIGTLLAWVAPPAAANDYRLCSRTIVIGESREGRNIVACERGDTSKPATLVLGQMHGNEKAGYWTARRLMTMSTLPAGSHFWIIPTMNPDGFARNSRQNARGVDLNRNFPQAWKPRSAPYYAGPRAASEPETRAVIAFVRKYQPHTTVSIHQPLRVVDYSVGGDPAVTRFIARGMNYPARSINGSPLPGTFTRWSNANVAFSTAVTFEFGRTVSTLEQRRLVTTIRNLAEWRATTKYATRIVGTTSSVPTDAGALVTINGRLEWKNYNGRWIPLPGRTLAIETAPTAAGPFAQVRTVTSGVRTGQYRTYTHPTATECVRSRFLGRAFLTPSTSRVSCVSIPPPAVVEP